MTRECERVGGINLGQGICDLPTQPLVRDGAIAAIRENRSTYSFPEGAVELRRAVAEKLDREYGIRRDPTSEIAVTVGASGAFTATVMALLDPGDGILLFEPYYGYHLNTALLAGLEPQFVPLDLPEFALDEARLRAAIRPNTRAMVRLHARQPERQDVHQGRARNRGAGRRRARSARHHRRDLRILPLRRAHPRPAGHGGQSRRSHGDDHGALQDVQHHRLAPRLRGRQSRARARPSPS